MQNTASLFRLSAFFFAFFFSLTLFTSCGESASESGKTDTESTPPDATTSAPTENNLLWKVSGNGLAEPSWLYGSFHLLGKDFFDAHPEVLDAYAQTKAVVVEAILDEEAATAALEYTDMGDTTLTDLLSPEDFDHIATAYKEIAGMTAGLEKTHPANLSVLFTISWMPEQAALIADPSQGMDVFFMDKAKADGKELTALETIREQLEILFKSESLKKQADMLVEIVKQKEEVKTTMADMLSLYEKCDLERLVAVANESIDMFGSTEVLLDRRNANWMTVLPGMMQEKSRFVVVGAMHLAGKTGLIDQLRAQGFTVEAWKRK